MLQINVTSQDAALLVFINLGWLMAEEGSHAEEGSGGGGRKRRHLLQRVCWAERSRYAR